ncbi:MAG: GntR family transcriptional regulator [Hyphomicrobiaceae bacterium]|nr:MAG: GntR family transcriptional regulator [Hyphomicrobiaceae bacterium]
MAPARRFKSTADYATAELQQLILRGVLRPGEKVDQIEIAAQLDVSRHPVRQAIERLAERGFIHLNPHRSAVVAEISIADMDELYRARNLMEGWAAREAWPRFTPTLIDEIRRLHTVLSRTDPGDNLDDYMVANRDFHLAFYQPCANRHMMRSIVTLFDLSERYQRTALHYESRHKRSKREHERMVRALEDGDCDALISAIKAHNSGSQATVRVHIKAEVQRVDA